MANATTTGGLSGGVGGAAAGGKIGGGPGALIGAGVGAGAGLLSGYYMDAGNRQREQAINAAASADQADMASMRAQYGGLDQFGQQRYGQQFANQNQALQAFQRGQMGGPAAQAYTAQQQALARANMLPAQMPQGVNPALAMRYQQQAMARGQAQLAPAQLQQAQAMLANREQAPGRAYQQAGWQNQAYGNQTQALTGLERAGIMDWSRNAAGNSQDRWRQANQAGSGNFASGAMVQGLTSAVMGGLGGMG